MGDFHLTFWDFSMIISLAVSHLSLLHPIFLDFQRKIPFSRFRPCTNCDFSLRLLPCSNREGITMHFNPCRRLMKQKHITCFCNQTSVLKCAKPLLQRIKILHFSCNFQTTPSQWCLSALIKLDVFKSDSLLHILRYRMCM